MWQPILKDLRRFKYLVNKHFINLCQQHNRLNIVLPMHFLKYLINLSKFLNIPCCNCFHWNTDYHSMNHLWKSGTLLNFWLVRAMRPVVRVISFFKPSIHQVLKNTIIIVILHPKTVPNRYSLLLIHPKFLQLPCHNILMIHRIMQLNILILQSRLNTIQKGGFSTFRFA